MKEDLTENPQKGELNFGEKFNIEQCPENDHLFCTAISFILFFTNVIWNGRSFIVGQFYGVDSITAVANGSQVLHMLTVIIVGLAMGTTVAIGRAVGGRRLEDAAHAIGNTITLFMIVAVVFTAGLLCFVRPIVLFIGTPEEAIAGSIRYLTICFIGIPFITAYNIISSIFRGMGDSKSPMYFIGIACMGNIVLDYFFIGAMQLRTGGSCTGDNAVPDIQCDHCPDLNDEKKDRIHLKKTDFRPNKKVMWQILRVGFPVAVQDGCIQIAFIIITVIANHRGLNDAAAVGIVEKMISAIFIIPSSMLATVSALSAQNIGAGKHDQASQTLKYATIITTGYGLIMTVLIELTGKNLVGLFTTDTVVVLLGTQYLSGYIIDSIFAGVHFSFSGYFAAYEKSYIGFIHNIIAIVLVRVPGSYLASKMFPDTLFPMGLAAPAGSLLSVLICIGAYLWMKKKGTYGERKISLDKM